VASGRDDAQWTRPPSGFTLIEMAVVLLVLGVALAVAVPALPRPRTAEEAAAAELARLLGDAREAAARRGGETTLVVALATGEFRATLRRGREGGDSLLRRGAIAGWAGTPLARPGADSVLVARFDPLGHARVPALRWRRRDGAARALTVDPWTGEVRLGAP
jgi:prepilin-type N-terminal cleavage/methylation domain-containing protein